MILTEACRAPVHCAYHVRAMILSHRLEDGSGHPLAEGTLLHPCDEEMRLLDAVANFLKAFAQMEVNMSTVRNYHAGKLLHFCNLPTLSLLSHTTTAHSLPPRPNGQNDSLRLDLHFAVRFTHAPTRHAPQSRPRLSHYLRFPRH